MPARLEIGANLAEEKQTHKDEQGHLIVDHAPELTWQYAEENWQAMNTKMKEEQVNRGNYQIAVLSNKNDVTTSLCAFLEDEEIIRHPVAKTVEKEYPDGELEIEVQGEITGIDNVYIVASLLSERDFARARALANHYKYVLGARYVTLFCSFLGRGRQDKNVDRAGNYIPVTINIRSEIGGLSPFIDRMLVIEPHSSATQAYAAEFNIPLVPLSPWQFMMNAMKAKLKEREIEINQNNAVLIRPDIGRNIAAVRAGEYLKIPQVSFRKIRTDGRTTRILELEQEEQELAKGRLGIIYDDEAATLGTLRNIADAAQKYNMEGLIACLVHCKFTPGWEEKVNHPMFKFILGTDSRTPIGDIKKTDNISIVSLVHLIREIILADIDGVNFWRDERFRNMILQDYFREK